MAFPQYVTAADNHNLGNTGTSWYDPDTWGQKLGNAGKFALTSVASGLNSFYNTGVSVGNFFGAGLQENDTQSWISEIDQDLGAYYRANREATDLTGFVLSSLIPGLGGVKLLNAGQTALKTAKATGLIGGNLGKAAGLLTPNTQKYVSLAMSEINASTSAAKLLNANTTKALASGLWQNTLEAAAFETVVQATMFKSPVLENQDMGDILTNVAVGGALGGVIGGAFGAAKIRGQLKKSISAEDLLRNPFQSRQSFQEITSDSERIIQTAYDSEMAARPVALTGPDGAITNNYSVNKQLFDEKIRKNNNDIRTSINNMAGKDTELGNVLANSVQGLDSQTMLGNFSGAAKIVRATEITELEKKMIQQQAKNQVPDNPVASRLVKVLGEDLGNVVDEVPAVLSLGDVYKGKEGVLGFVKSQKFNTKDIWDPMNLKGATAHLTGEARHIWAQNLAENLPEGALIGGRDIPLLEKALRDSTFDIRIQTGSGPTLEVFTPAGEMELRAFIKEAKIDTANELLEQNVLKGKIPVEQGTEGIAKIVNTRREFLEGTQSADEFSDLFAMQSDAAKYAEMVRAKDISGQEAFINPAYLPKYAKIVYAQSQNVIETYPNIVDAMVFFKSQQKVYAQAASNVVAKNLGQLSNDLLPISDAALSSASRNGSGAGLFSFENSNYGTLGSTMAVIGSVTARAIEQGRTKVGDYLGSALSRLGNNQAAALEFEAINQQITRSAKQWRISEGQKNILQSVEKEGVQPEYIHMYNKETVEAVKAHIDLAGSRTNTWREVNSVRGVTDEKFDNVFRPIRPDLKQYPHFFFVRDPQVTGTGHMSMVHAASEKELAALRERVPANYQVVTKTDTEEFFHARGEYEYSRTLHENYIDSDLKNNGVFSNFFPKSDPQKIIDDVLQQHYRESDVVNRELIRLKYESQFNWLQDLGESYSKMDTSKFASKREMIEATADNPYFNYIKTALNISKAPEMGLLYSFNKTLDTAVSKMVGSIRDTFAKVKTPAELTAINAELDKYGMKPAYYDSALHLLANHTAPRGELTKFVRGANSLLSMFTLGLDPLNSLNNAIGSNILRMTELKHLTRAINSGNADIAGELGGLAKIATPGTGDTILSPSKLVGSAIKNFWADDGALMARYKADGLIKDRVEQLKLLVDDFTLKGTESVADLDKRMNSGFAKAKSLLMDDTQRVGEKLSGNKLAEEFNRFISADVMRQITDIGVKNGLMDEATAKAYINTFVNRVEGNILASQRPLVFQGPVGQAIGLFQSYQFNLLQQLFRYSAEGSAKDLGMLLGLQSTLYGLQSLPAFQFVNTHIVGQMSGNQQHKDMYDAVYGAAGRTAGDWILYGIPSNLLQANIYSRGDINPRQITVLPTSMQEIPLVQGWGKFLLNMKETVGKVAGGGDIWNSMLQGLEHNGISRPLSGFAQTLQGGSTSKSGNLLYSNDLMSWATLTRMAGGRPLDEAITNDAMFRVKSYEAARKADMASLAKTVKTTLVHNDINQSAEQMARFSERYAYLGGKQANFNKWMMGLYKNTNTEQSETLRNSLTNPFTYKMQLLMGGEDE